MVNNMEILFRGFFPCEDGDTTIYVDGRTVKGQWVYGDYKMCSFQSLILLRGENKRVKVIPETVGQYINKTDNNNKKMFLGDNCRAEGEIYPIVYRECKVILQGFFNGLYDDPWDAFSECEDMEVVGTIWDKKIEEEKIDLVSYKQAKIDELISEVNNLTTTLAKSNKDLKNAKDCINHLCDKNNKLDDEKFRLSQLLLSAEMDIDHVRNRMRKQIREKDNR